MKENNMRLTSGEGVELTLGSLEKKVFTALVTLKTGTVRQILDKIPDKYAYTTIMTICDRLWRKKIFTREKDGRRYVYTPATTKEELDSKVMHKVLSKIADSMTEPVMEGFLDILETNDMSKLETLEKMVTKRMKERNNR